MDKEREINALADVLFILTKELVENPTFAIKDSFKYIHREYVTETLASEAAYYDFLDKTGKDIRNYDWYGGRVKCRSGEKININSIYTAEHMQTGKQFKDELINAYKNNSLTKDFIKSKLKSRYLCWVTKEEDQRLKKLGYNSNRPDSERAYKEAGITICNIKYTNNIINEKSELANEPSLALGDVNKSKGFRSRIGEKITFKNEEIFIKNGVVGFAAYNEKGKQIGYVFECRDQRTPAYQKAELGFNNEYKNKKYCRFTSRGERVC